jgi:bifunctional DNase/RNase
MIKEEHAAERVPVTIAGVFASHMNGLLVYYVVLRDAADREVWVYIGQFEAQYLTIALEGVAQDRPLTYDAMLSLVSTLSGTVDEIEIASIQDETFYAVTRLRTGDQIQDIDMRPSDALNLAVRAKCPIFTQGEVFQKTRNQPKPASVEAPPMPPVSALLSDPQELARMYAEDQADRKPEEGKEIDWTVVAPRDEARLARVKELCQGNALREPKDCYYAAMILQHGVEPEDYLLAHELCVVAASRGVEQAKWLAAASEDRFLMAIGRKQRFGTQFTRNQADQLWSLGEVDGELPDSIRLALNAPVLSDAQARAASMNTKAAKKED